MLARLHLAQGHMVKDGEEPGPADNTPGFVPSEWFAQFRKDSDPLADIGQIIAGFRDALTKIKEEMEKE